MSTGLEGAVTFLLRPILRKVITQPTILTETISKLKEAVRHAFLKVVDCMVITGTKLDRILDKNVIKIQDSSPVFIFQRATTK